MRRWVSTAVALGAMLLSVGAGYAGGTWAAGLGPSERDLSREATFRDCEPGYVAPKVERLGGLALLSAVRVAELEQPSSLAFPPRGGAGVIGEREGRVYLFDGQTVTDLVLDHTEDTLTEGDGGLLALTYSPAGDWLYVHRTRADNTDVITAYPVVAGVPDADGEHVVIEIDHPPPKQHHGGGLAFGPDGYLYISTGDGGGLGDPRANAQRLSSLLGKVLRIDPTPEGVAPYRVPDDNPFVDRPDARPEVFSYGLRNPYRIWFDEPTGDLWIADVGQNCWEEINWRPGGEQGGENFEWDMREGTHAFQGGHPVDGVEPVLTWGHAQDWCAVVGGFTYRGSALRALDGFYLHTDLCAGELVGVRYEPGEPPQVVTTGVEIDGPVAVAPGPD
ncbi:MAG: PQQ-dependent sugar dehydrogenase, partial [Acidimicrobiales bacterium]